MVPSEQIIERTFYISLLHQAIKMGLTINPDDYLPLNKENEQRFLADKESIQKFVYVFGIGNNQVRGIKECPRITLELQGYYAGDIGVEKYIIREKDNPEDLFQASEFPFETKDTTIDIHLVATTQNDMRILHNILHRAIPTRGYLVPYLGNYEEWKTSKLGPTGNLFIEEGNYYDHPDNEHGMLEKVYQYICKDGLLEEYLVEDFEIAPITDISLLLGPEGKSENDLLQLQVSSQ